MADDPKRSHHLLSDQAIPKVVVPRSEVTAPRQFKLPTGVSEPDPSQQPNRRAAGKPRAATGRVRDRTLNWFKTGDALEQAESIDGDYEPMRRLPSWPVMTAALLLGMVAVAGVMWLVS